MWASPCWTTLCTRWEGRMGCHASTLSRGECTAWYDSSPQPNRLTCWCHIKPSFWGLYRDSCQEIWTASPTKKWKKKTNVCLMSLDNLHSNQILLFPVSRYDPQTNRWTKVASMSTRRLGVGVAVLATYLYAVGGSDGTSPLNTGRVYSVRVG